MFRPMFKSKKLKISSIILAVAVAVIAGFLIVRANPDFVIDTFTNELKIALGTVKVNIDTAAGQVKLAECYNPSPGWTKVADTLVRDITGAYNSTIAKDIYCDDNNCILWTDGAAAPGVVCIATNSNVYVNLLWSKTDIATTKTWADSGFTISGEDIGGTHSTVGVGNNNIAVGGKNWLNRYYGSAAGMFDAMDACKAKGNAWRLPNILELDSIRDQAKGAPYSRLPGIISDNYWSSTELNATYAYHLNFGDGNVYSYAKASSYYVRCVRGW